MLRGLEWGLYIYENQLVRAKVVTFRSAPPAIGVQKIDPRSKPESEILSLDERAARNFQQIDFPEDARLENLNVNSLFSNEKETVKVMEVYTDPEIGGVWVKYVTIGTCEGVEKTQDLRAFISDYDFQRVD